MKESPVGFREEVLERRRKLIIPGQIEMAWPRRFVIQSSLLFGTLICCAVSLSLFYVNVSENIFGTATTETDCRCTGNCLALTIKQIPENARLYLRKGRSIKLITEGTSFFTTSEFLFHIEEVVQLADNIVVRGTIPLSSKKINKPVLVTVNIKRIQLIKLLGFNI